MRAGKPFSRLGYNMDDYKRILVDGVKYYGKHLILSAKECNYALRDVEVIANFLEKLVVAIDMVPYGEPFVARFGKGAEEGISAVQLIETSAVTVHTNDLACELYLDVFSCKGYNEETAVSLVKEFFEPSRVESQIILRK